jgi:hypothetical protein
MSWLENRTLPVAKRKHYQVYYRGASGMSDYLSLGVPFILNAVIFIMSAAHPSVEYMHWYLVYSQFSFVLKFFSTGNLSTSFAAIYRAEGSQIYLGAYDRILFSMTLSGTNTNWNMIVDGWSVIE